MHDNTININNSFGERKEGKDITTASMQGTCNAMNREYKQSSVALVLPKPNASVDVARGGGVYDEVLLEK